MSKDSTTNGKSGRAVGFRLKQSQATALGPFQLTRDQAALLLALETGNILDQTVVKEVLQIHQHRPHWVRVIKANLYGPGYVVSARSTRLGRIAAKRALQQLDLEAWRECLRKEQAKAKRAQPVAGVAS